MAIWFLLAGTKVLCESSPAPRLTLLTTTRQAHNLTQEQASHGYPVHLRGVVTSYDADLDERRGAIFMEDATGAIFIAVPSRPVLSLRPGTKIEVSGTTAPGDFAPIILNPPMLKVVGFRPLARPPKATLPFLLTGAKDAQRVEVEGIVHSVESYGKHLAISLATLDGPSSATAPVRPGQDYTGLVDSKVLVRGIAAPLYNKRGQLTGVRLLLTGRNDITVEEPASADPFVLPLSSVNSLLQYSPGATLRHLVHVRGRVTLHWPGRSLCLQDGKNGLCVQTRNQTALRQGELIDVAGFPALNNYEPTLSDAILRRAGPGLPILARRITPQQAFAGEYNSDLVQIEGDVIGRSLVNDPAILLSSGGLVFPAILPVASGQQESDARSAPPEGSKVLVTGVFSGNVDTRETSHRAGNSQLESFQILLRSPRDIEVLQTPSWWTAERTWMALGLVLILTLAVIVWVVVLRRRVEQQTLHIRRSEERFRHLAEHDSLTGLAGRALLHERLNLALDRARNNATPLTLLMMDVDNFKNINDSLGHAAGDEILRVAAKRIRASVRETDTVARMGGDEFMVLLPGIRAAKEAARIAANVVASVAVPIPVDGQDVPVSVSVGVSTSRDCEDSTALLRNVDLAMYKAKAQGRNRYQIFTPDMLEASAKRSELQSALNRALENHEFRLLFQPVVDIASGEVSGLEALVRWRSERLGPVAPSDFIPLAEETGLIAPIGEWVLREACRKVGELEERLQRRFLLAVNVSPIQLRHSNLPYLIQDVLTTSGRSPDSLELEITENVLVGNSPRTRESLNQIRDLGVHLAIDDFGTGFSSLAYITQFQVDRLKIDQSFIQHCLTEKSSESVTRVIIAMAHGLDMTVVAEGVETPEQYCFVELAGCDTAQGYYLSQPVEMEALGEVLLSLEERIGRAARPMMRSGAMG